MADLTAEGTQSAGLGTRGARYTFVLVWALGIWSTLMQSTLNQALSQLLLASALQLVAVLFLTLPGAMKLPLPLGLGCAAAAVLGGLTVLFAAPMAGELWPFNFSSYILALLTMRGNVWEGAAGGFALIVAAFVLGLVLDTAPAELFAFLVLSLVAWTVGIVWRKALTIAVRRERVHLTEAELFSLAADAAEAATAEDQAMIDEVRAEAGPVLEAIRFGRSIGDAEALRLDVLQEGIRDRIRSPQLRHKALDGTVRGARERGVRVLLLGSESAGGSALPEPLAEALAAAVAGVTQGSVTIRAIPDGRRAVVSLLVSDSILSNRYLFDREGELLEQR